MDEHDIMHDFLHGPLKFLDAITALETLGYEPKEAERIVSEWADGAEEERRASEGSEKDYR